MSTTPTNGGQTILNELLKLVQAGVLSRAIQPQELSALISAFLPDRQPALRSTAYLIISTYCAKVREGRKKEEATEVLVKVFSPPITIQLSETTEDALLGGVSLLEALFQVDWESASSIFCQDGILENIMDSVELSPSAQLSTSVAHLLSSACGHKECRALMSGQPLAWLQSRSRQAGDQNLRSAASVALVKLLQGATLDAAATPGEQVEKGNYAELMETMRRLIIDGGGSSASTDAVEGLAYLSADPSVKDSLSLDPLFLKKLFALVPSPKQFTSGATSDAINSMNTLLYGILVIIMNLSAYRPQLSGEQAQLAKLKRMAQASGTPAPEPSHLDDDVHVKARVRRLLDAGVLAAFASAAPSMVSPRVRMAIGKSLLSIVEDKDNRGRVLQSGGAKILTRIIKEDLSLPAKAGGKVVPNLEPIQALAKLAITASPTQVFGPDEGAILDAVRPFSTLFQAEASTSLQRFEAMMALTNLSSQSPAVAARIAQSQGLIDAIELALLQDHTLLRRAAMELLCNLIAGSDDVYERYTANDNQSAKSRIQILLALSDVDDMGTRLAASGALATLTDAPNVCKALIALQDERKTMLHIIAQLIDPSVSEEPQDEPAAIDQGLAHRGVVCARNIFSSVQNPEVKRRLSQAAEEGGLIKALNNITQLSPQLMSSSIKQLAADTVKLVA